MKLERVSNPDAICRESWWIGTDLTEFTTRRLKREKPLRAEFGCQPVSATPSVKEQSFMDRKGRNQ